ncbi:hypothetical protein D934_09385 [Xylella fastidiosa subsp. sandyi Ann-1]|uniref:Uncharacterized protein n=1 Tax=Xylella fastidiosa subsp. sandyi Ann-1 TaxID=155920 RepID=A0A060H832_XYLFS|nr:hypothetical protein D934_09385 [Xylella fastidiosa subsp. sandyi Ann-1]
MNEEAVSAIRRTMKMYTIKRTIGTHLADKDESKNTNRLMHSAIIKEKYARTSGSIRNRTYITK